MDVRSKSALPEKGKRARDSDNEKRGASPPVAPEGDKRPEDGRGKAGSKARKFVPL